MEILDGKKLSEQIKEEIKSLSKNILILTDV